MTISHRWTLLDKYRPVFLGFILSCFYFSANAQTYNPSVCCTVSNKSYGSPQAVTTDGRSWFYDATNFVMRDYNGTTEVFSYLNLPKYRSGHFPVFVHLGGILQGNGVWLGGSTLVYWFKDSTGNANLVRWYTDSTGLPGGPFYAIANNLSEGNAGLIKGNLSLDLVNNTSDAQKNAASVSLTNHTIDANNNTLLHIPNSALTNNAIGLTITANPAADIAVTTTPASLGNSIVANMPSSGTGSRGPLTATDWNFFDGKNDSTTVSGDSLYNWVNGVRTLQSVITGTTGASNGLSLNGATANLGQPIGAGGNPAQLLGAREIPLNAHYVSWLDSLNTATVKSSVDIWKSDTIGNILPLNINAFGNGGTSAGSEANYFFALAPSNYGKGYHTTFAPSDTITMNKWTLGYSLSDNNEGTGIGMPDAVLHFGYNTTANGARRDASDAAWRMAFETNYLGMAGPLGLDMEFHLPEITLFNGDIVRTNSYYSNKTDGYTFYQGYLDSWELFTVLQGAAPGIGRKYAQFSADNGGSIATLALEGDGLSAAGAAKIVFADDAAAAQMAINLTGHVLSIGNNSGFKTTGDVYLNQNPNVGFSSVGSTVFGDIASPYDTPDPSAIVQIWSTTKGFLPARMTEAQMLAISGPAAGLHIYNTDSVADFYYTGSAWKSINGTPINSGSYVPTLTGIANVSSSTADSCFWTRTGNIVTVFGSLSVTATLGVNTNTTIDISIPVASNLASRSCRGTANTNGAILNGAVVNADVTNDKALLGFFSTGTSALVFNFSFSYPVQ